MTTAPLPHRAIAIDDPSQVGEARRAAVAMAEQLGFDDVATGRVALVVTELGTNLARHARNGRLLLGQRSDEVAGAMVEVLSLDNGPGMNDIERCLRDGYSTGSTQGSGLGAVRRLANDFDMWSAVPGGTVILARIGAVPASPYTPRPARAFNIGVVALAAPGETVCGDTWAFVEDGPQAALLVADGLGHGPSAAEAAQAAVEHFRRAPLGSPSQRLEAAHAPMRGTRGAAVAIARLDAADGKLTFSGVGNVAGRVISGVDDRSLMSQHGTLGLQIRRLQDIEYAWPEHALVVLHSDGIATRWNFDAAPGLLRRDPSLVAAWLVREHLRGRDDATVAVVRRA